MNAKYADFDTVRVQRNSTLGVGQGRNLSQLSYTNTVDRYIDQEFETDTDVGSAPEHIVRSQDGDIIVVPMPDSLHY